MASGPATAIVARMYLREVLRQTDAEAYPDWEPSVTVATQIHMMTPGRVWELVAEFGGHIFVERPTLKGFGGEWSE